MVVNSAVIIAKLTPFATRTTELTLLVPPWLPQGRRHALEDVVFVQGCPGPSVASCAAPVARDWKRVIEYPGKEV